MEYEIVNLEEKKAVGISAVTNNKSPEMPKIIGGLWDEFYKKVYGEINDKANNKSIGMYHKYQPNGDYTVSNMCGGEQHKSELRSDYNTKWKIC